MYGKEVYIEGYVGKDPQFKTAVNGSRYAHFSVAENTKYFDYDEHKNKTKTTWHGIFVYDDFLMDKVREMVKKGTFVEIRGLKKENYKNGSVFIQAEDVFVPDIELVEIEKNKPFELIKEEDLPF